MSPPMCSETVVPAGNCCSMNSFRLHAVTLLEGGAERLAVVGEDDQIVRPGRLIAHVAAHMADDLIVVLQRAERVADEARRIAEASSEGWDVLESDYPALYFCELQYGCIYETAGINRQFLRALLMESLATLGVLDVAYIYPHRLWPDLSGLWGTDDLYFCGRYDGLLYVRLNPLGAYALGFADHYNLRAGGETQALSRAAEPRSRTDQRPAESRRPRHARTPRRAQERHGLDARRRADADARRNGGAFQELRDFLEANAAEGLPDNVQVFLASLKPNSAPAARAATPCCSNGPTKPLPKLIATSAGTNKLCFHAGENRLVVPAENLAAFSRALKKLGYVLPRSR